MLPGLWLTVDDFEDQLGGCMNGCLNLIKSIFWTTKAIVYIYEDIYV